LTLREIEYFLAVVDEGSFTRAARRVNVAQPSLSQQVRALEAELGGQLLERLPRGIRLTAAGRAFLPYAREALLSSQRAGTAARSALQLEAGQLEIAAVRSLVVDLLPASIKRWRELHPRTVIHLHEHAHRRALTEAVRSGIGDIAVGPSPVDWDGPVQHLGWQELVVVLSSTDQLAEAPRPFRIELLADRDWVLFERDNGLSEMALAVCSNAGFGPRVAVRTTQVEAAARLAAAGVGPAIVPAGTVPDSLDAAVLRLDPAPGYEIAAYTRREWSPLAAAYLEVLMQASFAVRPPGALELH
jgi:DNA-binding transcriptional LysR family regulator